MAAATASATTLASARKGRVLVIASQQVISPPKASLPDRGLPTGASSRLSREVFGLKRQISHCRVQPRKETAPAMAKSERSLAQGTCQARLSSNSRSTKLETGYRAPSGRIVDFVPVAIASAIFACVVCTPASNRHAGRHRSPSGKDCPRHAYKESAWFGPEGPLVST